MKLLEEIGANRQLLSERLTSASKVREKDAERRGFDDFLLSASPELLNSLSQYQSQLGEKAESNPLQLVELRKWLMEVSEFIALISQYRQTFTQSLNLPTDKEDSSWQRANESISQLYKITSAMTQIAAELLQLQLQQ